MTEAQAVARLQRMVAHDVDPPLSGEDLELLVALAKRPDADGRTPLDDEWVPTWDLEDGAATGWEWKAGRTSGNFNFGEDGQSFSPSQVHDHCMAMARAYRRGSTSVAIPSVVDQIPWVQRVEL